MARIYLASSIIIDMVDKNNVIIFYTYIKIKKIDEVYICFKR